MSSTTQTLRRKAAKGARILCMYPPYEGWEMTYDPRNKNDNRPWAIHSLRYFGHECRAEFGTTDDK